MGERGADIDWEKREITWDVLKAVTFAQAATVLADPLALTVFDSAHSQHAALNRRRDAAHLHFPGPRHSSRRHARGRIAAE
jgi:hypothetical protein